MDYELIIRPEAKADLLDAFQWYQEQQRLGNDFKLCVDDVISKSRNPFIHKTIFQNVRRSVTKRVPFGEFYTVDEEKIIVLAVMHARRDSVKWKNRI
ncbi:MAG: toxin ParE1/3/4 [Gammaproteobacteria bacterium]|jgi:toxin ParE1/3/4